MSPQSGRAQQSGSHGHRGRGASSGGRGHNSGNRSSGQNTQHNRRPQENGSAPAAKASQEQPAATSDGQQAQQAAKPAGTGAWGQKTSFAEMLKKVPTPAQAAAAAAAATAAAAAAAAVGAGKADEQKNTSPEQPASSAAPQDDAPKTEESATATSEAAAPAPTKAGAEADNGIQFGSFMENGPADNVPAEKGKQVDDGLDSLKRPVLRTASAPPGSAPAINNKMPTYIPEKTVRSRLGNDGHEPSMPHGRPHAVAVIPPAVAPANVHQQAAAAAAAMVANVVADSQHLQQAPQPAAKEPRPEGKAPAHAPHGGEHRPPAHQNPGHQQAGGYNGQQGRVQQGPRNTHEHHQGGNHGPRGQFNRPQGYPQQQQQPYPAQPFPPGQYGQPGYAPTGFVSTPAGMVPATFPPVPYPGVMTYPMAYPPGAYPQQFVPPAHGAQFMQGAVGGPAGAQPPPPAQPPVANAPATPAVPAQAMPPASSVQAPGAAGSPAAGVPVPPPKPLAVQPKKTLVIKDPKTGDTVNTGAKPAQPAAQPAAPTPAPALAPAPVVAKPANPVTPQKESAARAIKPPTAEVLAKAKGHGAAASSAAAPPPPPTKPAAPTAVAADVPVAAATPAESAPAPAAVGTTEEPAAKAEPVPAAPAASTRAAEPVPAAAPAAEPVVAAAPAAEPVPAAAPAAEPVVAAAPAAEPVVAAAPAVEPVAAAARAAEPVVVAAPAAEPVAAAAPAVEPVAAAAPAAEQAAKQAPAPQPTEAPAPDASAAPPDSEAATPVPAEAAAKPAMPAAAAQVEPDAVLTSEPAAQLEAANGPSKGEEAEEAPARRKGSAKAIAKMGEAKDDELRSKSDPFAPPKPKEEPKPAAPAKPSKEPSPEPEPAEPAVKEVSDNWESAAEEDQGVAPVAAPQEGAGQLSLDGRKVYSRDFMCSIARDWETQPAELAELLASLDPGWLHVKECLLPEPRPFQAHDVSFDMRGGRGGGGGRGMGGASGNFRGGQDEWARRGGAGGYGQDPRMGPNQRGMPPPPMGGRRGQDDKWERRGPPPPPSPGGRGGRMGTSSLHRTDNRYMVGKSQSEDPEEEKKQKQFQGILNKITPDNFEKLLHRMMEEVGITERNTLEGLIDKIFDKALTDTHFCEMYASLCRGISVHPKSPKFKDPDGGKDIDFRRLLLNKCQEEFEQGAKAMDAVSSREKEEAALVKKEEVKEEGELTESDEAKLAKAADRQAAEADRQARQRMLGNIQFIGHLYKQGLLTERIIHSCIVQLLKEENNPRPEDVECLCKLFTTCGKQLDQSSKTELRNAMKVYFERMERLRLNQQLDSRIRFMIQDVLDLRDTKWEPRQKKEGPKKIQDIHREAIQESMAQQQRDRDERRGGPRGRNEPMPGQRNDGYSRMLSKDEVPSRPVNMQRTTSSELSFRPAGGFGMRARAASPAVSAAPPAPQPPAQPALVARPSAGPPPAVAPPPRQPSPAPVAPEMSEEKIRSACKNIIEEFYINRDLPEALDRINSAKQQGASAAKIVSHLIWLGLDHRGVDLDKRLAPVQDILNAAAEGNALTAGEVQAGMSEFVRNLHLLAEEMPKAPELIGKFFAEYIGAGKLQLKALLSAALDVPPIEEGADPPLVDAEHATAVIYSLFKKLVEAKGEDFAASTWKASGLELGKFISSLAPEKEDPEELKGIVEGHGLAFLLA